MKILQINNFHYPRGGADRVYLDTIDLLQNNGFLVSCFSTLNERNESRGSNSFFVKDMNLRNASGMIEKLKFASRFVKNTEAITQLKALIKLEKPDIAHLHIFQSRLSTPIIDVLKNAGIPIVMTVHEYKIICPVYTCLDGNGNICEDCAGGNYMPAIQKKCNQQSYIQSALSAYECWLRDNTCSWTEGIDYFIFPSQFIRNKHLQYYPELQDKSTVVYNFLDLNQYIPEYSPGNYDLYFGRLSPEKGISTLIEAYRDLPNNPLCILGEGPSEVEMRDKLNQFSDATHIQLQGYLKGKELTDKIKNARFVIVPSEWYENNPRSIIEAQALGKPVIGADIGGIPELIQSGINGAIFISGDSRSLQNTILELSSYNYSTLSKNARAFAEQKFSARDHLAELQNIYSNFWKEYFHP